eukprot:3094578-Prymnesium_polylepis.1
MHMRTCGMPHAHVATCTRTRAVREVCADSGRVAHAGMTLFGVQLDGHTSDSPHGQHVSLAISQQRATVFAARIAQKMCAYGTHTRLLCTVCQACAPAGPPLPYLCLASRKCAPARLVCSASQTSAPGPAGPPPPPRAP